MVLRNGMVDGIVEDMRKFLGQEIKYVEAGIPWHRGYMFWGPPGTGKTSFGRALASHFNVDVYHISLPSVDSDSTLMDLLHNVTAGSILLIEDIDVTGVTVSQRGEGDDDDEDSGVTLSGLLNALDGISTPHGMITIMTSNYPQGLDSALTRKGRIDQIVHIDLADADQTSRIFRQFTGADVDPACVPNGLVPSDVIEIVKGTFDMSDPREILDHIHLSLMEITADRPPYPEPVAIAKDALTEVVKGRSQFAEASEVVTETEPW